MNRSARNKMFRHDLSDFHIRAFISFALSEVTTGEPIISVICRFQLFNKKKRRRIEIRKKKRVLEHWLGSAYCFVISGMTSLILWYQLDESFILAPRRPAVPLPQPDTVMVSDCCNCSAPSSYSPANQLAPSSWSCHIALMGRLGTDPAAPQRRDLIRVYSLLLMWNFFSDEWPPVTVALMSSCCGISAGKK